MKLYTRSDLVTVGVLASVGVIALVRWSAECNRLTPPPSVTTLAAFADCMPAPQHLAVINDTGAAKVIWVGDVAKSMFIPTSGPACYVFDAKGNLIQWELETGHGEATDRLLHHAYQEKPMTVQEAKDFFSGN